MSTAKPVDPETLLWAYVHGESPLDAIPSVETTLADDPESRNLLAQIQTLHGLLPDGSREPPDESELINRIEALYDREDTLATSPPPTRRSQSRLIRFPKNMTLRWLLATAATVALMSATLAVPRPPVKWQRRSLTPRVYRGSEEDARRPQNVEARASSIAIAIERAVEDRLRSEGHTRRRFGIAPVILSIDIHEEHGDRLRTRIEARSGMSDMLGEWTLVARDDESGEVTRVAKEIAAAVSTFLTERDG